MSTIFSAVLVTAPLAFLAGWILSKVVFRHISLTRPNVEQPRGAETLSVTGAGGSDGAGQSSGTVATDARRINILRQKLAGARGESQSLQAEIQLLKEAAAEREHAVVDLKRKLQMQLKVPEESLKSSPAREKQLLQQLEGRLATHQHRIDELKHELEAANTQTKRTVQRFHSWRKKIKPLAVQIRQQRVMIAELREELGRQELEQRGQEAAEMHTDLSAQVSQEDLQKLRGVGPAMHKKLNEQGVYRLKQLALMSSREFSELGKSLGIGQKVLAKYQWTVQARQLLNMPEVVAGTELMGSEALSA